MDKFRRSTHARQLAEIWGWQSGKSWAVDKRQEVFDRLLHLPKTESFPLIVMMCEFLSADEQKAFSEFLIQKAEGK